MDLGADGLLCAAAALAGAVNSIAGGGTLLSFPAAIAWGLPSTVANATNAVAMMPASLASAWAFRRELRDSARLVRLLLGPAIVGGVLGAVLLRVTPVKVFDRVVPWLVLGATLILLFRQRIGSAATANSAPASVSESPPAPLEGLQKVNTHSDVGVDARVAPRRRLFAVVSQLAIGIYGGFFGAAMGIIMLAYLSLVVPKSIYHRNAIKNLLAALINGVASIYFVWAGLVSFHAAVVMTVGAVTGGYAGGYLARRTPERVVRGLVVAIGLALSALLAYRAWK
jgi:uncharacterized membrane protein YfcA